MAIQKTPIEILFNKGQSNDELLRAEQLSPRAITNGVFDGIASLRQSWKPVVTTAQIGAIVDAFQHTNHIRLLESGGTFYKYAAGDTSITTIPESEFLDKNLTPTLLAKSEKIASVAAPSGSSMGFTDGDYDILAPAYSETAGNWKAVAQQQPADSIVSANTWVKVTFVTAAGNVVQTNIGDATYHYYKPRLVLWGTSAYLYVMRTTAASPTTAIIQVRSLSTAGAVGAPATVASFTLTGSTYADRSFDIATDGVSHAYGAVAYRQSSAGEKITVSYMTAFNTITQTSTVAPTATAGHRAVFCGVGNLGGTVHAYAFYTSDRYLMRIAVDSAGGTLAEFAVGDSGAAAKYVGRMTFDAESTISNAGAYITYDWFDTSAGGSTGIRAAFIDPAANSITTAAALTNSGLLAGKSFRISDRYTSADAWPVLVNGLDYSGNKLGDIEPSLDIVTSGSTPIAAGTNRHRPVVARLAFGEHVSMLTQTLHWLSRMPNASWLVSTARISRVVETAGSAMVPNNYRFDVILTDFKTLSVQGVARTNQAIGNNTILAGACSYIVGDKELIPASFSARPYLYSAASSGAAGAITTGVHRVRVVEIFTDELGNVTESEPSNYLEFTAGGSHNVLTLGYMLFDNGMTTARRSVRVYRTTIDDLNTYYLDDTSAPLSDASLVFGAQLPTTGGVLPNEPAPAHTFATIHQNRIFACGGEFGDELYFTQELQPGYLPSWNQTFFFRRAPKDFGRLVALASLDDRLIVFGEKKIGVLTGSGPDRTGAGDGFSQIQAIVGNYGCALNGCRSLAQIETGIWFESPVGMRFIGRDLQLKKDEKGNWVGEELDTLFDAFGSDGVYANGSTGFYTSGIGAHKGSRKLSAVKIPDSNNILWVANELWSLNALSALYGTLDPESNPYDYTFTNSEIQALVYDTSSSQWSVRSSSELVGTTITPTFIRDGYEAVVPLADSAGRTVLVFIPRVDFSRYIYLDSDDSSYSQTPADMIVDTGWLGFAQTMGFQRVYDVSVLLRDSELGTYANPPDSNASGASPSACNLKIEVCTDYNANTWTTVYNAATSVKSTNTFAREVQCQLPTQKCEAIRFRFTISGSTKPIRLVGARLNVGVKPTNNKGQRRA